MIIRNFDELARTPLRKDALTIINAGYEAIQTDQVIKNAISLQDTILHIKERAYDLTKFKNIYVVAFGKSSYQAAKSLEDILGERITKGYAIGVTQGEPLQYITTVAGTHPIPSDINYRTARQIIELLQESKENDLILCVISGGGSALLAAPHGMSIESQADIITALMNAGATIQELNTIRKHISEVKGGRLAALAYPSKCIALIFSDVPGNELSTIASGPTVMDATTIKDAETIMQKYEVLEKTGLSNIPYTESPKDPTIFEFIENILILDPSDALHAMEIKAKELGYTANVQTHAITGDAHNAGKELLNSSTPHTALLAAGETTISVDGTGVGGRNQELVLANLQYIKPGHILISAASDGHDHSNSAGAIADGESYARAKTNNLNPEQFLRDNNSYEFFVEMNDSLDTGQLDSNIADMFLVLQQ